MINAELDGLEVAEGEDELGLVGIVDRIPVGIGRARGIRAVDVPAPAASFMPTMPICVSTWGAVAAGKAEGLRPREDAGGVFRVGLPGGIVGKRPGGERVRRRRPARPVSTNEPAPVSMYWYTPPT